MILFIENHIPYKEKPYNNWSIHMQIKVTISNQCDEKEFIRDGKTQNANVTLTPSQTVNN